MVRRHATNNFDFLRFAAAAMVVVAHSYALTGRPQERVWHGLHLDFGFLGVAVFFVVSGFLITQSFVRDGNLVAFFAKRVLRIAPALAVVVAVSAFVIGPAVTNVGLAAYFGAPATWLYPVRNLLLYPLTYTLPGVFSDHVTPSVNGSLWTLRLEFSFYVMIAVLGRLGWLRMVPLTAMFVATWLAAGAALVLARHVPVQVVIFFECASLFLGGAAVAGWRAAGRAPTGWTGAAVALAALGLVVAAATQPLAGWGGCAASLLALPVLAFALFPLPVVAHWHRLGDWSYGIYIWAFPVQQILIERMGEGVGPATLTLLTWLIVFPLAAASWWLIERPALRLKARLAQSPRGLRRARPRHGLIRRGLAWAGTSRSRPQVAQEGS